MRTALSTPARPRVFVASVLAVSLLAAGQLLWIPAPAAAAESDQQGSSGSVSRIRSGLVALYDFVASSGSVVKDRSAVGQPLHLKIENPRAVNRSKGSLVLQNKTLVRSDKAARKINDSIRRSQEMTLEAWIRPAKVDQDGPARILTISRNSTQRNVTLGQDGDRFDVRLRTSQTSANGIPSLSTRRGTVSTRRTHVVYTRDRSGHARIYVNGKRRAEKRIRGRTGNWQRQFQLGLGNELSDGRPWLGTFYLVAIYRRALTPQEVARNFRAGPKARAVSRELAQQRLSPSAQLFQDHVAPIFAQHCLECHDATTQRGGLDLSRKNAALAGGDSGPSIVPGKIAESLLWQYVELDDMPQDRDPLSSAQKKALRDWIATGGEWTTDFIDPAIYAHGSQATDIWVQRLTRAEYIETVRSTVDVDIRQEALRLLPPDLRADGFSNTAYNLNVDLKHVEAYAELAEMVVERMDVGKFAARFSKSRRLIDDDMRALIGRMGKWVLRGPLEEREVVVYRGISTSVASAGGDFEDAVRYILQAMLQSPRFIYRVENQRGDGTAWPVGQYELASRLSYILWGAPPDQALLEAADNGELADREVLRGHVRRMLEDPRAVERSAQFIHQWLNLDRLDNLQPSPENFPNWNPGLAADMREETLAYFRDVVWKQNRPLADLLNAQLTYVTPRLAEHYGLRLPDGKGLARYDLASVPERGGLLTQGSVLTVGGDEASMVARGLFVLHDLLRGAVKDPPPCVDTTPVPTRAGLTQRSIAEARIANTACGGCHAKFEPLAFGLERFDGLGSYHRRDEHGNRLREDGQILFPGRSKAVPYETSRQLMDLLANSQRVNECLTWKVAQFALGRPLVAADAPILDKVHQAAEENGGTYASLITALVMSDLVQMTRTEIAP